MAEATVSPESLAFKRCYESLRSLSSGIESLSITTYAKGIITRDLKNKCMDKKLREEERTESFLQFMEQKIQSQPETFHKLVKIIEDTSGLEYVAKDLIAELEKAKLEKAELEKAELEKAELEKAKLEKAELEKAKLEKAELEKAELEKAELEKAELEKAEREASPLITTAQQDQPDQTEYFRETDAISQALSTMKLNLQSFITLEEGRGLPSTPPPTVTQRPVDRKKRTSEPFIRSQPVFPQFYDLQTATSAQHGRPKQKEATDSAAKSAETLRPPERSSGSSSDEYFTPPQSLTSSKNAIDKEGVPQNSYESYINQQNTIARLQNELKKLKRKNERQVARSDKQVESLRQELYQQLVKYTELEDQCYSYIFQLLSENNRLKQQLAHKHTPMSGRQVCSNPLSFNFTNPSVDQEYVKKYIRELERENEVLKSQLEGEKEEKKQIQHQLELQKTEKEQVVCQLQHERSEKKKVLRHLIHKVYLPEASTQSTHPPSTGMANQPGSQNQQQLGEYHHPTTEARLESEREGADGCRGGTLEYAYHRPK